LFDHIKYNNFIDSIKYKIKLSTGNSNSPQCTSSSDLILKIKQNEQMRRNSTSSTSSILACSSSSNQESYPSSKKKIKKLENKNVSSIKEYNLRNKSTESESDFPLPPPPPTQLKTASNIPNEIERSIPNLVVQANEKKTNFNSKDLYIYNPIQKYSSQITTTTSKQTFEKNFNLKQFSITLTDCTKNVLFKSLNADNRSIDLDADMLKKLNLKSNKPSVWSLRQATSKKNIERKRKRYNISSDDSIEKTTSLLTKSKIYKINLNENSAQKAKTSASLSPISNELINKKGTSSITITHLPGKKIKDYFKVTVSPKIQDICDDSEDKNENQSILKSKLFFNLKF
jgi:hypothetical protein